MVSLRLGQVAALTVHRTVIHYRSLRFATLPAEIATNSPQANANTGFFCRSRHAVTLQGASRMPRATGAQTHR